MSRFLDKIAVAALALGLGLTGTSPALASPEPPPVPGGRIGTLTQGRYTCETPGDATGPVGFTMEDLDIRVVNGSGYKLGTKRGTYLLTGDLVTMTEGPLKGLKLQRMSDGFLRRIEPDGTIGNVRCVLGTRAVANAPYVTKPGAKEAESRPEEEAEKGGAERPDL